MAYLLIGAAAVIAFLWIANMFVRANPAQLAPILRRTIGGLCILLAGFLALRGALPIAIPVFLLGLALLGVGNPLSGLGIPGMRSQGQRSSVRTSALAMELDHDSGDMEGEVLNGPFAGRRLSELSLHELLDLLDFCRTLKDRSEALLEAYLDRAHPDWRGGAEAEAKARKDGQAHAPGTGAMTVEEALAILGVDADATPDEIRAAHRRLMKKYHPDSGGSDYLAAKVNQAKDVLLKKAARS